MNGVVIYVVFPGLLALILFGISRWRNVVYISGVVSSLTLALAAWLIRVDEIIELGPVSFKIHGVLSLFGRRFIIDSADRPLLILFYLGASFWFVGAYVAGVKTRFIPLSLAVISLLTAALLVQPFLYAAILIEMAVLVSAGMMILETRSLGSGASRYLIIQTLTMPFILLTGWLLSGIGSTPGDSGLLIQVGIFLAFSFGLMLSLFPFHSWIPMVAEESHPYITAFIFFLFPMMSILFTLTFLERFNWLYTSTDLYIFLRFEGFLMVLTGGFGAAFNRHLAKLMGFALMIEIGCSLLALSLGIGPIQNRSMMGIAFGLFLPRGLALGIWALSLSIIYAKNRDLTLEKNQGVARQYPIVTMGIFIAILTLVGFPLSGGFPIKIALWQGLLAQFPLAGFAALIGAIGLLIGGLRVLAVMVNWSGEELGRMEETRFQAGLIGSGIFFLFLLGLFPQWFFPTMLNMALTYLNIGQ